MFFTILSQGQVFDDFKDGDLTVNPKWEGDLSKFTTENGYLRSNSLISNDAFYLSTLSNQGITGQWEMLVNLNFSTSSKNYVNYCIVSDTIKLFHIQKGYYVQIGGTKDKLSFMKIDKGVSTELFSSPDGTISDGNSRTRLKIIRDSDTIFYLYADYTGGENYSLVGSIKDTDVLASKACGIIVEQSTASFFQKHYFDDFYAGQIIMDTSPPVIVQLKQLSLSQIKLTFNEDMDSASAIDVSNFIVNKGVGSPFSIGLANKKEVTLSFLNELKNPEDYEIKISNLKDVAGNALDTVLLFTSLIAYLPQRHELLITELLPIPDPPVYLPKGEFIELYNPTDKPIQIGGVKISDATSSKVLPAYVLLKNEYVILCNVVDKVAYEGYGNVLAIAGLPSLNNSGEKVRLYGAGGELIHEVEYYSSILPAEKGSGWSLEMIDVSNPCNFMGNWAASKDGVGGTPGKVNSVNGVKRDSEPPKLVYVYPASENKLELYFNESLLDNTVLKDAKFRIMETGNIPDSIFTTDSLNKYALYFSAGFVKGEKYSLEFSGGEDCAGNVLVLDTVIFGLGDGIVAGSFLINEVLYDPYTGGEEFVELYNNTDHFLDLKDLKVGKRANGVFEGVKFVSTAGYLVSPKSFVVLTKQSKTVSPFYSTLDSAVFYETLALPSLINSGMEIVFLNAVNEVIDAVNYSPKWHYEIIGTTKGVSLERISKRNGNNSFNWTSASFSSGYATPGVENSQNREIAGSTATISLESKTFSPNGDGYQDILILNYTINTPNTTANLYVFNEDGVLIKHIAKNLTLSSSGIITWDGEREMGGKAHIGIYVLLFEHFTPSGKVEKKKLSCALVL